MRGNAFGIIQQDWIAMSLDQWREFIRVNGDLSQKQRRDLVEQLPQQLPTQPAVVCKNLLGRVMHGLSDLSSDERRRWWKCIKSQPAAIHVGLERGLDFRGVEEPVILQVMAYQLRHYPALAAKIWDQILPGDMRKEVMGRVIDAWMDGDEKVFEKQWGPRLDVLMADSDKYGRISAVSRVLGHAYEMNDSGYDIGHPLRALMHMIIRRCAPPEMQLLTEYKVKANDPIELLPVLVSEEQRYALSVSTPQSSRTTGSPRL